MQTHQDLTSVIIFTGKSDESNPNYQALFPNFKVTVCSPYKIKPAPLSTADQSILKSADVMIITSLITLRYAVKSKINLSQTTFIVSSEKFKKP